MTDLEKYCAKALRLSEASAEALISQIDLNIDVARAELIRSGLSNEKANSDDVLVINAIIKFVCGEMASAEIERTYSREAFRLIMDELRKSEVLDA